MQSDVIEVKLKKKFFDPDISMDAKYYALGKIIITALEQKKLPIVVIKEKEEEDAIPTAVP